MTNMTYGILPTRAEFDTAFEREYPNGYRIYPSTAREYAAHGLRLDSGTLTADQLWSGITEIVNAADNSDADGEWFQSGLQDQAMDLVSGILETLGFEWV